MNLLSICADSARKQGERSFQEGNSSDSHKVSEGDLAGRLLLHDGSGGRVGGWGDSRELNQDNLANAGPELDLGGGVKMRRKKRRTMKKMGINTPG